MNKREEHINQKAAEALDKMTSHEMLQASDDFWSEVESRLEQHPPQASFHLMDWMKVAALITIMLLNGILLFSVLQGSSTAPSDDYSTVVDDYFPQYQTLDEELE